MDRTLLRLTAAAVLLLLGSAAPGAADEPALPEGLSQTTPADAEPALPSGLTHTRPAAQEPDLPAGLDGGEEPAEPGEPPLPGGLEQAPPTRPAGPRRPQPIEWLNLTGFWEVRAGLRTQHDRYQRQASLGETRLQLELEHTAAAVTFKLTTDVLYDAVFDHHSPRLEEGRGLLDLREASVAFSPLQFMDVKIGRQILTWGTGDLLFLNDLFPKDWQAFFIGRDVEYLKAPSDAVKVSLFSEVANLDFVYTPRFDADRFIRGRRISFFNGLLGRRSGRDAVVDAELPDRWFRDGEFAARLSRTFGGWELAGYGYAGYWKSPAGLRATTGDATFPRLSVWGGSVRGQLAGGIANFEAAYYDSRQDRSGVNPFVRNSEVRLLAGYERDLPQIAKDLTLGVQYYLEYMMEYDSYRRTLPAGSRAADEDRHVLTVRLSRLAMNQNLLVSLFVFYSPTDADAYLRPLVRYKIDDHWTVEVGGNVFFGANPFTFFGQFANNTNVYAALRYGF